MKVPDGGHEERMLACGELWTLDGCKAIDFHVYRRE